MRIASIAREVLGIGAKRGATQQEQGAGPAPHEAEEQQTAALLALDVGAAITRASLFERVDGQHRLLAVGEAPTSFRGCGGNVLEAVWEAVAEVERITNRQLLGPKGTVLPASAGDGVAATVAVSSGLLRVAIVGLTRSYSLESAHRAAAGMNVRVTASLSLDSGASSSAARMHALCQQIRQSRPDAVLIAGGTEKGAVEPILEFAQALAADGEQRPGLTGTAIIFSGNSEAATSLKDTLGGRFDLRPVLNLRPSLELEDLEPTREALRDVWRELMAARMPGMGVLQSWLASPVLSTAEGFSLALRFLAAQSRADIFGFDLGASCTTLVTASDKGSAVHTHEPLGVGVGALGLAEGRMASSPDAEPNGHAGLMDYAHNKSVRPWTIPETMEELRQEMGLAKEVLSEALARSGFNGLLSSRSSRRRMLVARGASLAHCPCHLMMVLALVDAAKAAGALEVGVDSVSILSQLGAVATLYPQAAAEVALADGVERLGTWVGSLGQAVNGTAAAVTLERDGKPEERCSVAAGSLAVLPLGPSELAYLTVGPVGGLDLGGGRGRSLRTRVQGGRLGVIVDLRDQHTREAQGEAWLRANDRWLSGVGRLPVTV